jgi:2'-5' RNA ligase
MHRKGTYSVWLIPGKPYFEQFTHTIKSLAASYHSFTFLPHVSIYRIKNTELKDFATTVNPHIARLSAIPVQFGGLQFSSLVNKTLYLPVVHSPQLKTLHASLQSAFHNFDPLPYDPHVSVLYKRTMSDADKKTEVQRVKVPKECVLTKCVIMHSVTSLTAGSDSPQWEIVHEQLLY